MYLRPHPEEARSAVSKDGHNTGACAIRRDASLRDAPQDEVGDGFTASEEPRACAASRRMRSEIHSQPLNRSGACPARARRGTTGSGWSRSAPPGLSLIHISEPTRLGMISYAVF